ncbi:MAG: hypothetical protein A2147_04500 [Chloroflexi bacterium RBG_16_57_8]|nr:MAG: hypothetical protein A2147_04500 [Chloroflexi bacterium RBG_16_57_8]
MLLLAAVQVLMLAMVACGKAPAGNLATTPPTSEPEGRIAASPLAILTSAGADTLVRQSGASDWVQGKAGMTLGRGYAVKTGAGGATITLFEGTTVELDKSTEVDLSELNTGQGAATAVRLKQEVGKTISRVKKLADPAARYEIETAAAVAAVRGTTMLVDVALDGTTTVGNIEGAVSVTARGVEVSVPPGSHSVVPPGQAPGAPQPGATPSVAVVPVTTPPPAESSTPAIGPVASVARVTMSVTADRQSVYAGDAITYTYTVNNAGDLPLSNVSVVDDKAGPATYDSGDADGNRILAGGETWTFSARYVAGITDVGQLKNTAKASGSAQGQTASASAGTSIEVVGLAVKITSLTQGSVVGRSVLVSGTVNDPSVREVTLALNGSPRTLTVTGGSFTASVELAMGTNTITVIVTKAGGISATDTVVLEPAGR